MGRSYNDKIIAKAQKRLDRLTRRVERAEHADAAGSLWGMLWHLAWVTWHLVRIITLMNLIPRTPVNKRVLTKMQADLAKLDKRVQVLNPTSGSR